MSESSLITAFGNDKVFDLVFAQQVLTLGVEGDVLLAISTSGNSKNVVYAAQVAKAKNMKVIALSGKGGGLLSRYSDVNIIMHGEETFKIQENHLPIYHLICLVIENEFF